MYSFYFALVQEKSCVVREILRVLKNSSLYSSSCGGCRGADFSRKSVTYERTFLIPAGMWYSLPSICILLSLCCKISKLSSVTLRQKNLLSEEAKAVTGCWICSCFLLLNDGKNDCVGNGFLPRLMRYLMM